ncbi:hypothetical protein KIH78_09395, partial [Bifidobacterium sp. 79T10]|nr:hypothetical protein [Bifidobacterium saguinibicoloris]
PEPEEPRPEPLGGSERTTYTQTPTNATPPHHNTPQTPETQQTLGVSKTPKTRQQTHPTTAVEPQHGNRPAASTATGRSHQPHVTAHRDA